MTNEVRPACGRGARPAPVISLGSLWLAGWLFTIGFVQLTFWKGVLALILWPYYLGTVVR